MCPFINTHTHTHTRYLGSELGSKGVRAAAQQLLDGHLACHVVLGRVMVTLAPAGLGAHRLAREALAVST